MQDLEFGVEYYPNPEEGEQWQELTEGEFLDVIAMHKARGYGPVIDYDVFTVYDNGRTGRRLTIRDVWGIYYG